MSSSSGASSLSTGCCLESTPCWHRLGQAIKVLLGQGAHKLELDLGQLTSGAGQRMRYEDFEPLLYQLLLKLEPADTRRRLGRALYPTRNKEQQAQFLEAAAKLINERQLHERRVSASQLRSLGGGPFRAIVCSLVRAAADKELDRKRRRIAANSASAAAAAAVADASLGASTSSLGSGTDELLVVDDERPLEEALASGLAEASARVERLRQELQASVERLASLEATRAERQGQCQHKWAQVTGRSELVCAAHYNQEQLRAIRRADLSRLEATNARLKLAMERLMALPLSDLSGAGETAAAGSPTAGAGAEVVKRLSQFIRDKKNQFGGGGGGDSRGDAQIASQLERMANQLADHDRHTEALIEDWRAQLERRYERLLDERPKLAEKFAQLARDIPLISIEPPIRMLEPTGPTCERPAAGEVEAIVRQFLD